jgi:Helix-turn-helix domain
VRFTPEELAEIRAAFRRRIATEHRSRIRVRRTSANRVRSGSANRAAPAPVHEPEYDDGDILTTRDVADALGVSTNVVRRWAEAGILPSFRTVGGRTDLDGRTFGAPQVPDFAQRVDERPRRPRLPQTGEIERRGRDIRPRTARPVTTLHHESPETPRGNGGPQTGFPRLPTGDMSLHPTPLPCARGATERVPKDPRNHR